MKSFTDFSQSKKLSEFLPHESADAHYWCKDGNDLRLGGGFSIDKDFDIPAWSLAALLSVLPDKIHVNNDVYYLNLSKDKVDYRGYMTWNGQLCVSVKAENLLDSCYKMIINLHEQNIL